jgi:hypothetical protein
VEEVEEAEVEEAEVEEAEVEEAGSVMVSQREPSTAWPKARARVMDSAKAPLMDCVRARVSEWDSRLLS